MKDSISDSIPDMARTKDIDMDEKHPAAARKDLVGSEVRERYGKSLEMADSGSIRRENAEASSSSRDAHNTGDRLSEDKGHEIIEEVGKTQVFDKGTSGGGVVETMSKVRGSLDEDTDRRRDFTTNKEFRAREVGAKTNEDPNVSHDDRNGLNINEERNADSSEKKFSSRVREKDVKDSIISSVERDSRGGEDNADHSFVKTRKKQDEPASPISISGRNARVDSANADEKRGERSEKSSMDTTRIGEQNIQDVFHASHAVTSEMKGDVKYNP